MLPGSGRRRCRALFSTLPEFSDLTPTQYDAAYTWLQHAGLLESTWAGRSVAEQVFKAALAEAIWFRDADVLIQSPGELPEDAHRAAETLGMSTTQAFAQIHAVWGKVDAELRTRIGSAGEAALVELLEQSVRAPVDHVSQRSDGYGYDIAVQAELCDVHLEVKTTNRRERVDVFLSRHEYEIMTHDSSWQLVVVRLAEDLRAEAVCSVRSGWIRENAPKDQGASGRWESCRLSIPPAEAESGIARLMPLLTPHRSPLIDGSSVW
ncbi:protein NO VEIN domain-containing protein [Nonomuraea typhae]|uniref:Protein NO VEIN domain-containing protein n=1 Tax=Nonomuraea typhae TaxID=2603600 RepID=A0ABW7Z2L2_9ACTN